MADGIGERRDNRQKREIAEDVARRLEYKAEQLLKQGMRPETPTGKHKWATGKEKWEAQQAAGRKAGRSNTRTEEQQPADVVAEFMSQLYAYVEGTLTNEPIDQLLIFQRVLRLQAVAISELLSVEDFMLASKVLAKELGPKAE